MSRAPPAAGRLSVRVAGASSESRVSFACWQRRMSPPHARPSTRVPSRGLDVVRQREVEIVAAQDEVVPPPPAGETPPRVPR